MTGENILNEVKENKVLLDYEYISNDPEENADNFDPKWALFRNMRTDEERYKALRKTWGNTEIPDPRINLTCRQSNHQSESDTKVSCSNSSEKKKANLLQENPIINRGRRNIQVSRRRSRSCTRPYEQLISNLQKDYQIEYSQLIYKHKAELQEMLQIQMQHAFVELQKLYNFDGFQNFGNTLTQNLKIHQEQQVSYLLSNQYKEWQRFLGEKSENFDACKRYMEEVKAFFTFYQKINDDEVTLQMTDEQYEHTVETEKMYSLYSVFYR